MKQYVAQEPDELSLEESDVVNVFKKIEDGMSYNYDFNYERPSVFDRFIIICFLISFYSNLDKLVRSELLSLSYFSLKSSIVDH